MSQTIKQLRILSFRCGGLPALLKKRAEADAFADSSGTIRVRPRVLCDRDLVGHRLIPRTVTT